MTSTQSAIDADRFTGLYLRFSHGDATVIDELFADSIKAHLIGDTLLAADYAGKPAIREFIARTIEMNHSASYQLEIDDVLCGKAYIAIVGHVTATEAKTGKTSVLNTHDVFHFDREGKADEMWSLVLG
jgi:ketosteroid isomerase-like protein